MRLWIAALAMLPAVAWGQLSYCTTSDADDAFTGIADIVLSNQREGVGRNVIEQSAKEGNSTPQGIRLWLSVIDYVYSRGDYASRRAAVEQARMECYDIMSGD